MNFRWFQLGSNTSLLIKIGAIKTNTFMPTRNKFVYSCSIKICALGFDELWTYVLPPLVVEVFPCKKDVEMLEDVVGRLARGQVNIAEETNVTQFIQYLKHCLCDVQLGVVENWPIPLTNGCWCYSFQCIPTICWAYVSDVMISLRFRKLYPWIQWIRWATDDQRGQYLFFGASLVWISAASLKLKW